MTALIVDDSILMRNIEKEVFRGSAIRVVGEGSDGRQALALNRELRPDLIVMDINMPIMDGLAATTAIMADRPTAIIIFSNEVAATNSFRAIQAGAVDVLPKPDIDEFNDRAYVERFIASLLSAATAFRDNRDRRGRTNSREVLPNSGAGFARPAGRRSVEVVVIGASTGGPPAVRDILHALPADFPAGIAIVQHIEERFDKGYAAWLQGECALTVRLAKQGDVLAPGLVLVAPGGRHLVFSQRILVLADDPPVANQKPSVDRLFESAAASLGEGLAAVLLTGMGSDGAEGLGKVREAGGLTIAQDEASSLIFGMPKAAIERGAALRVLGLSDIPAALLEAVGRHG